MLTRAPGHFFSSATSSDRELSGAWTSARMHPAAGTTATRAGAPSPPRLIQALSASLQRKTASDPDNWSVAEETLPAKLGAASAEHVENQLLKGLDASLLRGVSLSDCLSGWGKHFANNSAQSMYDIQRRDYGLSFQVSKIDNFLSHDWNTSRRRKVVVMMIYFNAHAATVAAVVCAVIVGLCRETPWQDIEAATNNDTRTTDLVSLLPQATFVLFLFLWQRVRGFFRRPKIAFLDRLCIAQHDPKLKTRGILGLASFLDHSEELTILWSPRFFTRLWCCFEVAAFLRKSRRRNQRVAVLPAATAGMQLAWIATFLGGSACLQILWWAASVELRPPQSGGMFGSTADIPLSVGILAACCLMEYQLLGVWAEIQDINRQVHEFSWKASECFCCAHHHQHPETGETLLCDRALVFDALKTWYVEADEEHLDKFNQEVQTTLGQRIRTQLAANMIFFHSTLILLLCGTYSPWLCDSVAWMRNLWVLQSTELIVKFWRCVVAVTRFYLLPVITSLFEFLILAHLMVKLGFLLMVKVPRLVAATFAGLVAAVLLGAINWAVDSSSVLMAEKGLSDSWPFLALAWLLFWWILHKFFKVLPRMRRVPCFTFAG